MSRWKALIFRPARTPFWNKKRVAGRVHGVMALLFGLLCLGIALLWTSAIIEGGRGLVGNLAGESDWVWIYGEVVLKTGIFWIVGAVALLIGAISVLFSGAAIFGESLARKIAKKKEKDA